MGTTTVVTTSGRRMTLRSSRFAPQCGRLATPSTPCSGDHGHEPPPFLEDERFNPAEQPVVGVSWFDAVAYCEWLSRQTACPIRLPTEASASSRRWADSRARRLAVGQ